MKILSRFMTDQLHEKVELNSALVDKPVTLFYDYPVMDLSELKYNPYNILFIQEPNQFFGFHDWAIEYGHYFDCIFTWSEPILTKYPNTSKFFPFAASHYNDVSKYQYDKKFEISFLCGNKQIIEGHRLRHKIYEKQNEIKIPNHFIYTAPWDGGKSRCWESMYHIAVENHRSKGYFTEKIMDAFLSKTIPVYWGCNNISEFYNQDAIITFNDENELTYLANQLTPEYYESKKVAIEENYSIALEYADIFARINYAVETFCNTNKI